MNVTHDRGTGSTGQWIEQLTLALRMRNISGPAIGQALTEVESHLAETGESPWQAFGDPGDYARSLEFTDEAQVPEPANTSLLLLALAFFLGWTLLVPAAGALLRGESQLNLRLGEVVSTLVLIVAGIAIVLHVDAIAAKTGRLIAVVLALVAVSVGANLLLRQSALSVSSLVATIVGAVAFLGGLVAFARLDRNDEVTDPVTGQPRTPIPGWMRLFASPWIFLVLMTILITVEWRIGQPR